MTLRLNAVLILCSVLTQFAVAQAAFATPESSFSLRLRVAHGPQSCDEQAQTLAARFSSLTGRKITDAKCVERISVPGNSHRELDVIAITYTGSLEIIPAKTLVSGPDEETEFQPGQHYGIYSSYDNCLNDSNKQISNFEASTALKAFALTCEADQLFGESYIMTIMSFGNAKTHLYAFEPFRHALSAQTKTLVSQMLKEAGASAIQSLGSTFLYYAPSPAPVRGQTLGLFNSEAQCSSQLSDVKKLVAKTGATVSSVTCISDSTTSYSVEVIDNSFYWLKDDQGLDSPVYYSFSECMNDRSRYLANYSTVLGHAVGGLCEISTIGSSALNQYRVVVFATP
jgi:hypothetical protein